jgi:hypothetical protein
MTDPTPSRRLEGEAVLADPLVRELLDARLVCVFATFAGPGIHAVPMWYAAGDGCVILATGSRSQKVRNLDADPRATLVLHDSRPGFEVCGVSMIGDVEVVRGPGVHELVERVHERYVDPAATGNPDVREFLSSDDVALRYLPRTALAWDERASAASLALRASGGARPLVPTDPRP